MTIISSSTRSLFRKSAAALVLASALASMSVAVSSSAQAAHFGGGGFHGGGFHGGGFHGGGFHRGWGRGGWGRGAGIGLGLGLLGAAAYDAYGSGQVCYWRRQFDAYGNYLGRVQVCPTY